MKITVCDQKVKISILILLFELFSVCAMRLHLLFLPSSHLRFCLDSSVISRLRSLFFRLRENTLIIIHKVISDNINPLSQANCQLNSHSRILQSILVAKSIKFKILAYFLVSEERIARFNSVLILYLSS